MTRPPCNVPGCASPHHANGLCRQHDDERRFAAKEGRPTRASYEAAELAAWTREWLLGRPSGRSLFGRLAPWSYTAELIGLGPVVTGFTPEAVEEIGRDWAEHAEAVRTTVQRRVAEGTLPAGFRPLGELVEESGQPPTVSGR